MNVYALVVAFIFILPGLVSMFLGRKKRKLRDLFFYYSGLTFFPLGTTFLVLYILTNTLDEEVTGWICVATAASLLVIIITMAIVNPSFFEKKEANLLIFPGMLIFIVCISEAVTLLS